MEERQKPHKALLRQLILSFNMECWSRQYF